MPNEIELKKAWNLIIDYCESRSCEKCIFENSCIMTEPMCNSDKIEV